MATSDSKSGGLERVLVGEVARVTEAAAIAAARLRGRGDEKAADKAAVDAMRYELGKVHIRGRVVIGEGEMDESPMLYIGEEVGIGDGPEVDIAVDPLEGTTICAKAMPNALAVLAIAERGGLLNAPDMYMNKIAIGPGYPEGIIDLDAPPAQVLTAMAKAKGVPISEITACILDRPRHAELIKAVRGAGAGVQLIPDGDIAGVIWTHGSAGDRHRHLSGLGRCAGGRAGGGGAALHRRADAGPAGAGVALREGEGGADRARRQDGHPGYPAQVFHERDGVERRDLLGDGRDGRLAARWRAFPAGLCRDRDGGAALQDRHRAPHQDQLPHDRNPHGRVKSLSSPQVRWGEPGDRCSLRACRPYYEPAICWRGSWGRFARSFRPMLRRPGPTWASRRRRAACAGASGSIRLRPRRPAPSASAMACPSCSGRVLASRGIAVDDVPVALDPSIKALMPDPSTLRDMDKGAARLADAILRKERIAVFGDYDVDGACSSALMKRFLAAHGLDARIYIPDRMFEGYGPNPAAIETLAKDGAKLIVTVDCGTTSIAPLAVAGPLGTDVVVVDHHQADERLPDVAAVINPNRQDDLSGLGHLCAAGVTFMVLVATSRHLRLKGHYTAERPAPDLLALLDLVALATVCDVVPLRGLNRAFVTRGLQVMRQRRNIGLKALNDAAGLAVPPTPYHLGFVLGPRINAGGRIGDAALGARLLATDDEMEAARIAVVLDKLNRERKAVEAQMLDEAIALADDLVEADADVPLLMLGSETWHKGVVGLVASRLVEPTGTLSPQTPMPSQNSHETATPSTPRSATAGMKKSHQPSGAARSTDPATASVIEWKSGERRISVGWPATGLSRSSASV